MSTTQNESYDFIIVGAGIAGTVLASRLHEKDSAFSILLIEAGPDPNKTPLAATVALAAGAPLLRGTELDWNYLTVPQKNLDGRRIYAGGGKGIGGGSIINFGLWTRGDAKDYEDWATLVGDRRWSWEGFLPYFRKTEHHHDPNVDPKLHGRNGPVHIATVSFSGRKYPLKETVKAAWAALGVKEIPDVNCGDQIGMAEETENHTYGKRTIAAAAYPLDGVTILSDTLVRRVIVSQEKVATGAELTDGRMFSAKREVIVSSGSIRTPQILMLSGIGPAKELSHHGIKQIVDSPEVGRNLWDHLGSFQAWKLRHPEIGAAFGTTKWTDPSFKNGNPIDWWINQSVPTEGLKAAMSLDSPGTVINNSHPLLRSPRSHLGMLVYYIGSTDGTVITTIGLNHLPTTRGTITLASVDPADEPFIDHNYLDTEADRYRHRVIIRMIRKLMETPAGQEMVTEEVVPEGLKPITTTSTDEQIDARVRQATLSIQHPSGTASMGKVVDNELRVKGVRGLRVVDASVIPTPISSPIQACIYALAEQAVDIILSSSQNGYVE